MPTLPGEKAQKVRDTDTTSPFAAVPEGHYLLKLTKVEATKSKAGDPMWIWYFDATEPKAKNGLREYTVLTDAAMWKIAQIFEAFGTDPATSTDDLLGKTVVAHLGIEIQSQGKNKGTKRNYIAGYPEQTAEPKIFEVEASSAEPPKAPPQKATVANDDIPF